MREKPDCDDCQEMYRKKNEIPPCADCMPSLMPVNVETVRLWALAGSQHIMGFGGPVDIDLGTVIKLMELLNTKNKAWVLRRLKNLHNKFLKDDYEKREAEKDVRR